MFSAMLVILGIPFVLGVLTGIMLVVVLLTV